MFMYINNEEGVPGAIHVTELSDERARGHNLQMRPQTRYAR